MDKKAVLDRITGTGVVTVIRAQSVDEAAAAISAIQKGGVSVLEITMTVPGAVAAWAALSRQFGRLPSLLGFLAGIAGAISLVIMLIATIPDWPFKNWGHDRYYFSHSLFVTLLLIFLIVVVLIISRKLRIEIGNWAVMIGGSFAWLSHLLLDSFYNHGKGIAIYWPVSKARLALPVPWFDVGVGSTAHIMHVFLIEFICYFPLLLLALLIRWKWNS
jgi:membrane-bound metal-dependent hydrolase YbcI (DUF457 family)